MPTREDSGRLVAIGSSIVLVAFFLTWLESAYQDAVYIGTLYAFGAIGLLCVSVALCARPNSRSVVKMQNLAWGTGATVVAFYFCGLLIARTIGIPGYHRTTFTPMDVIALVLSFGYWLAYVDSLRHGGVHLRRRGAPDPYRADPVALAQEWRAAQTERLP